MKKKVIYQVPLLLARGLYLQVRWDRLNYGLPVISPCNYITVITAVITVITAAHSQLRVIGYYDARHAP